MFLKNWKKYYILRISSKKVLLGVAIKTLTSIQGSYKVINGVILYHNKMQTSAGWNPKKKFKNHGENSKAGCSTTLTWLKKKKTTHNISISISFLFPPSHPLKTASHCCRPRHAPLRALPRTDISSQVSPHLTPPPRFSKITSSRNTTSEYHHSTPFIPPEKEPFRSLDSYRLTVHVSSKWTSTSSKAVKSCLFFAADHCPVRTHLEASQIPLHSPIARNSIKAFW